MVPGVLLTLFLASFVAFALARTRIPGRRTLLIVFTAGNLLPPQVLITPLYTIYTMIPLPWWLSDSLSALRLVPRADRSSTWRSRSASACSCCTNFMRTIPESSSPRPRWWTGPACGGSYWQVTLPLCRPALAALATLEFTWIYNDFLWALVLMSTGDKLPVTSALNNLRGQFFTDYNLLAAGSVLVALPTLIVFQLLHKQFIAGLTLGSTK